MSIFVVTGATGHVGSVVARELLAAGHEVRAIVRSAEKAKALAEGGAKLVLGELDGAGVLEGALRGADGVFLMMPPPPADAADVRAYQDRLAHAEAAAVTESGVAHVVMLSSWGAELGSGTGPIVGLHVLEKALGKTSALTTIVRAGSFTENLLNMLPAARHQGVLPSFSPAELKLPTIATRDIATVAVRALLTPPKASEVVYVLGAHEYSALDQAELLSRTLGKPVKVLSLPPSAASAALQQAGVGRSMADLFQEMYEGAARGLLKVEPGHRVEKGPTTMEDALAPHLGA